MIGKRESESRTAAICLSVATGEAVLVTGRFTPLSDPLQTFERSEQLTFAGMSYQR